MPRHDGKGPTGALHHRRPAEQSRDAGAVEGRRHDEDAQVVAQARLCIEGQREAEIGIEATLVELVEEHGGDALQRRIVEDHAGEDALGDDLDPRARRDLRAEAHAQADPPPDLLAKRLGHPVRDRAGRDAPRLENEDLARPRPGFLHQNQRHTRRFTGAGRRNQDGARRPRKGLAEGGQCRIDGQVGSGHAGRLRFLHRIRKRRGAGGPERPRRASGLRRLPKVTGCSIAGRPGGQSRDVDASRLDTPGRQSPSERRRRAAGRPVPNAPQAARERRSASRGPPCPDPPRCVVDTVSVGAGTTLSALFIPAH